MMKLWGKNSSQNKLVEKFTVGKDYILDQKFVKYDCKASIAHANMLMRIGVISSGECEKLVEALTEIINLDNKGAFLIKVEEEDCHTAIENYLIKKLGIIGEKIHTARSRNDQILTALRLFYKDEIKTINKLIDYLIESLISFKEKYDSIELPGYTHMRKAMPSSVYLWADSFIESMNDNKTLLSNIYDIIDRLPSGTGAGYGLPIQVDRILLAKLLGFSKIQKNPIYVQNSRGKYESSILHVLSQIMFDLNKISSDIILFSMSEFGYFELSPNLCTGSSIMPQKRNPDVLEIIRANYHRLIAYEFEVKNMISNLITGYNRDIQLTKEPVIKGFELIKNSLNIMRLVIENLDVNSDNCKKAMTKELYATERAYDLVKKGVTFREAYQKISKNYE